MEFYTRKSKRIFCALMSALGYAIIVGIIVFLAAGAVFKPEQKVVDHQAVEQMVGEEPSTMDYDGGYLNEEYKKAYADYQAQVDAERQKQQAIISANLSVIFWNKMTIALAAALLAAIPAGILAYRGMVSVLHIGPETVRFTYVSGKKRELHIQQNEVIFSMSKVYSRAFLYIPQYVCQFNYYLLKGKRRRKDAEAVYLSKADGIAVHNYLAAL